MTKEKQGTTFDRALNLHLKTMGDSTLKYQRSFLEVLCLDEWNLFFVAVKRRGMVAGQPPECPTSKQQKVWSNK